MRRAGKARRRLAGALAVLAAVGALLMIAGWAKLHLRAAAVLLGVVEIEDPTGLTALVRTQVGERDGAVGLPGRSLRARYYSPLGVGHPPVVALFHGVHHRGIDEPRFQRFARALSSVGLEVVTPELAELLAYRVEPQTITDLHACGLALAEEYGRLPGAFAISFAGGLLLMAAAEAPPAYDYVVAVGAHHDLNRLARYYAGASIADPQGNRIAPRADAYGARVIVRAHAERFFAPADVDTARRAIGLHLAERYRQADEVARALSPAGQERMRIVLDAEHFDELGKLLLRAVERGQLELDRVSPRDSLEALATPTFLLHGRGDPVIPSAETRWLAREVPPDALRRTLVSPVLTHMDLSDTLPLREYWEIVRFVAAILREAD